MDVLSLLEIARECGLRVSAHAEQLRVTGPPDAGALARLLLDHKDEVLRALGGSELLHHAADHHRTALAKFFADHPDHDRILEQYDLRLVSLRHQYRQPWSMPLAVRAHEAHWQVMLQYGVLIPGPRARKAS